MTLPHHICKAVTPNTIRSGKTRSFPTPEYIEIEDEEQPKMVLPYEPVRHCMMVYMGLCRLLKAGWRFTSNLEKIFEAIKWYLLLGESFSFNPRSMLMIDDKSGEPYSVLYVGL